MKYIKGCKGDLIKVKGSSERKPDNEKVKFIPVF